MKNITGANIVIIQCSVFYTSNQFDAWLITDVFLKGRALRLQTSDGDRKKLSTLAGLAVQAGFDWVHYATSSYIHASVIRDGKLHCILKLTNLRIRRGESSFVSWTFFQYKKALSVLLVIRVFFAVALCWTRGWVSEWVAILSSINQASKQVNLLLVNQIVSCKSLCDERPRKFSFLTFSLKTKYYWIL